MAKKIEIDIDVNSNDAVKGVDKLGKSVDGLGESTDELNESTERLNANSKSLGSGLVSAGEKGKKGLKGIATGFKGVGLAIKAAGIGLAIAAFAALKEILEKQQPVLDFLDTAFTSIGLAISQVSESLSSSNTEFSALSTIGGNLLTLVLTPMKVTFFAIKGAVLSAQLAWESSFLGGQDEDKIADLKEDLAEVGEDLIEIKDGVVDAAVSIKDNFSEAVDEVGNAASNVAKAVTDLDADVIISQAKRTTDLKNQAKIREAINRGIFEQYDREAELLRQVRDDSSKSIDERIAANNELALVLQEQEKIMLSNAAVVVRAARLEFNANKTTENRVALIEAQNEQEAIRADITGRRSEQLANEQALEQEVADAAAEKKKLEEEKQIEDDKKEKERKDKIAAEDKKREEEKVEALKSVEKAKADIRDASISNVESGIKLIASLDEDNKGLQAAALIAANAAGIAKTVITTQAANAAAVAEGVALAIPTAGASVAAAAALVTSNNISAGISIGTSIAATAKGLKDLKKGGSTGGKPSLPTPKAGGSASAPAINEETLFSTQNLEGAETEEIGGNQGINQIKAVVVESDITNAQKTINNIEESSEIG